MPPKRKTTAPSAAPANTSTTNVPPRRRGRPPIMRNNESDANNDDLPQAKRQRTEDVEASQDSDPQSLSGKTHDVDVTSPTRDTSRYHPESLFLSDLGQKAHPETDGEDDDDGEFSTGLRKETSESPAKKTRGTAPRRGKGILPATRSSPRKQAQSSTTSQPQTRLQDEEEAAMKKSSSLRSSSLPPPPATITTTTATTSATVQTTSAQLQRVKRKRGRPPKITTRVVDSQSLSDQPAVTAAERTEGTSTIAIPTAETEENISPVDSGGPAADDEQLSPATAIVPSQAVSSQPTLGDISQQEIPRLPQSPEHHHQATASPGLEVPTHSHTSHPTTHVLSHPHSHPASLYPPPPMQYAYYSHHPPHPGAGHYPFTHAPPPPPPPPGGPSSGAHPYTSSASQGGLEYSSSFATTVPTSPGGSFTHPYPQHSDQGAAPTHPHHAHNILDSNAPHGNPFPPPGSMGVPSYYTVPPPLPQSDLSAEIDQHERSESELGLASAIAVNGGVKRRVPPPSGTGKAGGRAGRGDHVACHFCRGRKLKCDGRRPTCGHCSLRSLACAYDDFIRRRGPGKKEKNNKRNSKNASNSSGQDENEGQEQNMMLIGPDIAGAGPSQAEILVTLPSQSQPDPLSISSSSIDASIAVPPPQRRRRRNPTNQGSAQSSTSILRFDTAGEGSSSGSNILSGLKPSAVAYAVETNERLPVNVNVGIPNVGMDYYAYHAHLPPGASHDPHQHQHQHHHHLGLSPYAQQGQAVGYYPQQPHHPTATVAEQESAHHQYGYDGDNDEEHDEDDGDEDADGDADSPNIESQRPHQQAQYDPHHPYAHAPPPHTHAWPEPPGAHTRV